MYLTPLFLENLQFLAECIWARPGKTTLENIQELIRGTFLTYFFSNHIWRKAIEIFQCRTNLLSSSYENIVNILTAIYLSKWLNSDPHAYKNLHAFAVSRFSNVPQPPTDSYFNEENNYNSLVRASKKYSKLSAGLKDILSQEWPYVHPSKEKNPKSRKMYHFKDLWMIEAISDTGWDLLSLYFEYKKFLQTTSKKVTKSGKESNDPLINAYKDYLLRFHSLIPSLNTSNVASQKYNDIEYVVTSMMLYEMEYSTHFLLSARIAQHMDSYSIIPDFDKIADKLASFYFSIADDDGHQDFRNGHPRVVLPIRPFVICPSYFNNCHYIFDESFYSYQYMAFYGISLLIIRALLVTLLQVKPPWELPSWTNQDYKAARYFYEKDFWKKELLSPFTFTYDSHGKVKEFVLGNGTPQSRDNCCENIRAIYTFLNRYHPTERICNASVREIIRKYFYPGAN